MDTRRAKRTGAATLVPLATEPALSAGAELLKNKIKFDKFTGFFDKILNGKKPATHCNINRYGKYMSLVDSNKAAKNSLPPHLPAFTMI